LEKIGKSLKNQKKTSPLDQSPSEMASKSKKVIKKTFNIDKDWKLLQKPRKC